MRTVVFAGVLRLSGSQRGDGHGIVDANLSERVLNICTAKGIGLMTVVSVLAETQCFKLVTKQKQLASYAGDDIVFNDSGLKRGKTSISKKGESVLT